MTASGYSTADCINDRHWYVFLASSFIFFIAGLSSIILFRLFVWFVHRKRKNTLLASIKPMKSDNPNNSIFASFKTLAAKGTPDASQTGSKNSVEKKSDAEIGWLTEAKDWAGELISGQTTTGRILVRIHFSNLCLCCSQQIFVSTTTCQATFLCYYTN